MNKVQKILQRIYSAIEDKKGEDILIIDVSRISSFADYFFICHGRNEKQNQAICDAVQEKLKKEEYLLPNHVEGYQEAEWILMDYPGYIIHIFSPQARRFYKLEKLWSDGEAVEPAALTA
ncbi:MAG: ribosome silencing factor [Acidobacteria bacterium]|nr:ribosome silencing factor [Acidobacteriota bacterium]